MIDRQYYSVRTGKHQGSIELSLEAIKQLFETAFWEFDREGYFQEYFGIDCVDEGLIPGKLGRDVAGAMLLALRKDGLWPIGTQLKQYSEDDLFDVLEFLHDHVSKPTKRHHHDWNQCGWHCEEFDPQAGQKEFCERVNRFLREYSSGYELSEKGEILTMPDQGMAPLLDAPVPAHDAENVSQRIALAIAKYRRHRSTLADRRDALRDLADVLEYLRPRLKGVLDSKDEDDLFNIANNFGIRHHNQKQKTNYDKGIWYSWLFYYYLASIHAALRMIERRKSGGAPAGA